MKIWVKVTWTLLYNSTSGSSYRGTGLAFDTVTKTIDDYTSDIVLATLDPKPTDAELPAGQVLYFECAPDYTQTSWVYAGGRAVSVATEANSATCGWTPPKTCDLGTASVQQQVVASGVRLTVRYSGAANGAVYYSLDGGTEQTSPVFPGVAAGQHQLQVRDDGLADCARTVPVYVEPVATAPALPAAPSGPPLGIDFVAQPLFYPLSGQPANALVEVELWAESAHGRGDYAPVLTLRKRASTLGLVSFRLDTLLRPLLSAFVPPAGVASVDQVSEVCTTNLVNYYLRTTTTPPAAGAAPTYAVSALRTALRGGLPAEWQDSDYFARRLSGEFGDPPFLSWQPVGPGGYAQGQAKAVVANQPEWLFFLVAPAQDTAQLRVRRAYAGATPVVDYEPLAQPAGGWTNRLLAIPLKDSRAGYDSLSLRVETTAGVVLSQEAVYRFVPASERTRFVLFTNSLGGLDTLRCEWVLGYTLEATADAVELPPTAAPPVGPLADRRTGDLAAGRKLKLATGWLTPAELLWAQELVLSRELWQQVGPQLRPLDWPKRSLVAYGDEPGLRGLLLEFDYAYAPTAYAPVPYA